jgi:hypothetical protein
LLYNETLTKQGVKMAQAKEAKIKEEPLLEINVKVDQTKNGEYVGRLNWSNMNWIDLEDIFQTPIGNEKMSLEFSKRAEIKCKMFKKRLKQYILEKCDQYELENFDWSDWDEQNS